MEHVRTILSLVLAVTAVASSVVNYVLFAAKLRWELDNIKAERQRIWLKIDANCEHIVTLQKTIEQAPATVEKRLDLLEIRLQELMVNVASMSGKVDTIARFVGSNSQTK